MFKLRAPGLSHLVSSTLLCASILHSGLAGAAWTSTSTATPTMLTAGSGNAIYAADLAAIYASSDGGNTWSSTANPGNSPYTALAYGNNALWLGTKANGTYTSADGKSWVAASTGQSISITLGGAPLSFPPQTINSITSVSGATILAGNAAGLYRSTNNGAQWNTTVTGLPELAPGLLGSKTYAPINALTATSAGTALAASSIGIYRSTDGGASWSLAGLSGTAITAIVAIPGSATVYAIAGGLYQSLDDGRSWAAVSAWTFGTPTALTAHPADGATIYAGDSQGSVHSSKDAGKTWAVVGDSSVTSASIQALAVPSADSNNLVAATAKGLFLYTGEVIAQPPFSINARFAANPGDGIESDEIIVAGLTGPTAISISGGSYSINGGAYTSQPGTVTPGARVKIKLQASASYSTKTSATLTIGKRSAAFEVTTLKKTVVTNLTDVLKTNTGVTLSNGELSLSNGASLEFKSTTPDDVVIKPASGASFTTKDSSGNSATYSSTGQGSGTTFVTRSVTNSSGATVTGVAIANGQSNIVSSNPLTIPFITNGSSPPALTLGNGGSLQVSANSQQSSAGLLSGQATLSYNGIASSAGKINTFAAGSTTIYGGETVSLTTSGALKELRLGSLNGDQQIAGDPLTLSNLDSGVTVPKLDGNLQRLGNTTALTDLIKSELDKQFGGSGTISYSATTGVVVYQLNGKTYRFIPVGNATVQLPAAAQINSFTAANAASAASGTFSLISRGVQLTMTSTLAYFNEFDQALKAFDRSASFKLKSSGAFKINVIGNTVYAIPSSATNTGAPSSPTIAFNGNGQLTFQDSSGGVQILYPVFADMSALDQTLKGLDPKASISYSGDGSTAASFVNSNFAFKPDYFITPLPSSHANDLWWVEDGGKKIYIRYPDNTAQWFSL